MKALLRLVAAIVLVIAATTPVAAADTGWTIDAFRADITIQPDGSLAIVETIDVDFGALAKHGIFRTIPTKYRYDERRDRVYALSVNGVTDQTSRPVTFQLTRTDAATEIKIGDAARTVSGKQTYRIAYRISGALNAFPDHDELFWNVNGAAWDVPTRAASAGVVAPAGSVQRATCFEGPAGSTAPCRVTSTAARADFIATRPFSPGEQLTIVTALRTGAVAVPPPVLVDRPRGFVDYFSTSPAAIAAAVIALVGGIFGIWWLWWTRGRDRGRPRGAIIPEYEPPDKLRPAQLGVLVDETADPRDLIATIVDLAVRGYLTITEHPKEGLFGHADWTLDQKKPGDDLLLYERTLFDGLFRGGPSVVVSSLKGTFAPTLLLAESHLYADGKDRGWFVADPARVRTAYASLGCLIVVAGIGLVWALGASIGWGLVGLAIVPAGALLVILHRAMPARTEKGAALLAQTLGFKRYMDTAETDRAAFAEKEGLFTAYLPYAVMFGSVDKWVRAFAGLDIAKAASSFYSGSAGPNAFNAAVFASSFNTFSSTLTSTVISTPGGSGGSGFSGGFSGGGGGGGGGGSW
ncbi:MAG: DUF2207 domain-containing protein [Chloroflexota bacterium]